MICDSWIYRGFIGPSPRIIKLVFGYLTPCHMDHLLGGCGVVVSGNLSKKRQDNLIFMPQEKGISLVKNCFISYNLLLQWRYMNYHELLKIENECRATTFCKMLFQFKRKWTCLLNIFVNHCGTGLLYVFYSNQSFRIRLIFDRALTIHIHFLKKVDNRFGLLIFPSNEQQKWIGIGVGICVLHCLTYCFGPPWYTRSQC